MSGRPLPQRLRLGPAELDRYLAGQLHGLAYMRRLREIEEEEERHLRELEAAWHALAAELDDDRFALAWREAAAGWSFRRANELIARHNAYYAIEARVPMNPRTGGYAKSWQRDEYDADWILDRFPGVRALGLRAESAPEPEALVVRVPVDRDEVHLDADAVGAHPLRHRRRADALEPGQLALGGVRIHEPPQQSDRSL